MQYVSLTNLNIPGSAIRDVTLHIPAGTCYGIVGATGAGKSALLNAIAGLSTPASGGIAYADAQGPNRPGTVGMVSPRINLPSHRTVAELLSQQRALLHGADDQGEADCQRAIRWCALEQLARTSIAKLSFFNKRRVALALALVSKPSLLLIDEPMVDLAAHEQQVMIDILENLRDRNMTIIITTRGNAPMESLFDQIAVLSAGKIIAELSAQHIRDMQRTLMIRTSEIPTAAYEHIVAIDNSIIATHRNIVLTGDGVRALAQILQVLLHYSVHIFCIEPRNHPLADLVMQARYPVVLAHRYPVRLLTNTIRESNATEEVAP
jgi:ABC-type multidrug transport system ATPase subunit